MDRSAESPIPEHVANAARNDIPRAVLSYADNLVLQAREILDRHGVALEDLKKPEVRERIPAEDMRRLLGLSAKNAAARRGEVDASARREIMSELDEREKTAQMMLGEAIQNIGPTLHVTESVCNFFLRAGLPKEALEFVKKRPDDTGELLVRANLALAREKGIGRDQAMFWLTDALHAVGSVTNRMSRVSALLDCLDVGRSLSDDMGFLYRAGQLVYEEGDLDFLPEAEWSVVEFERRNLAETHRSLDAEIEKAYVALRNSEDIAFQVEAYLCIAETRFRIGTDSREALEEAYWILNDVVRADDRIAVRRENLIGRCLRMASRIGNFEMEERFLATGRRYENDRDIAREMLSKDLILGYVDAGEFDTVLALMREGEDSREKRARNSNGIAPVLVAALVEAGEIERAKAVLKEFAEWDARLSEIVDLAELAKRASDGENMLAEAKKNHGDLEENLFVSPDHAALYLVNISIATTGYARAEKKRVEQYAAKR